MTIRITTKVKQNIKLKDTEMDNADVEELFLNEWYINLFHINRIKYYIITESKTLYSYFIKAKGINTKAQLLELITDIVMKIKIKNNLTDKVINPIVIKISKTKNRSIVGSQNDLIHMAQYSYLDSGIIEFDHINRTPMSYISSYPDKEFEEKLKEVAGK